MCNMLFVDIAQTGSQGGDREHQDRGTPHGQEGGRPVHAVPWGTGSQSRHAARTLVDQR